MRTMQRDPPKPNEGAMVSRRAAQGVFTGATAALKGGGSDPPGRRRFVAAPRARVTGT